MRRLLNLVWALPLAVLGLIGAAPVPLEAPEARPGEWGYRPADQSVTEINPPGFSWVEVPGAQSYEIQIAADVGFADPFDARGGLRWPAYTPARPLPPGIALYWRYRAQLPELDGEAQWTEWSARRSFVVSESAPYLPMPATEELKARIPAGHPRLMFRPEAVDSLRALAQGDLAGYFGELRAAADQLLAEPPDTTEPPLYPEGTERKGEEWKKIWWGNRLHAIAVADGAALLAFVYQLTGEPQYGAGARDLLMAVTRWDPQGSTEYEYNDEAAMPLLYMPSRAYTWAYDVLTEEERAAVVAMMAERGRQCYEHLLKGRHLSAPFGSHSNRAWHWLGEVGLTFHDTIPAAPEWLDYAMHVFYTAYPAWGGDDGGWHEGISYWSSYVSRFLQWGYTLKNVLDIDPFKKPYFQNAGYFAMYTMPPGTQAGAWGDLSPYVNIQSPAQLTGLLASGAKNPMWQWYAETVGADLGGGYLGFLARAAAHTVEPVAPEFLPSSRAFEGVGVAVLNSNLLDGSQNNQVHFKSSPYGRQSHGYNANNAFMLYAKGQPLLTSSGRRDVHGSPHHTRWMWHAQSDNVVLFGGEDQIRHDAKATGRITRFETTAEFDLVEGDASGSYRADGQHWLRRIVFLKPNVVVIHDVLRAPQPTTFDWILHARAPFEIGENAAGTKNEVAQVEVRWLAPAGLNITQSDQFDPPPHAWAEFELKEWHLRASTREAAPAQQFVTLLTIDGAAVESALEPIGEGEGYTLRLKLGEQNWVLTLGAESAEVRAEE